MRTIVFVHSILDPENNINIKEGKFENLVGTSDINSLDLYAIEAAMQIKEKHGGEVIAISIGLDISDKALRYALSFGCDKAVLIQCPYHLYFNNSLVAHLLKNTIEQIGEYDLILGACTYNDTNDPTIFAQLSRLLMINFISLATNIILENNGIIVSRKYNDEIVNFVYKLPLAITVSKEYGEPRYPSFLSMQKAMKENINIYRYFVPGNIPNNQYISITNCDLNRRQCEFITGNSSKDIANNFIRILKKKEIL